MRVIQRAAEFDFEDDRTRWAPDWVRRDQHSWREWFLMYCKINGITPEFVDEFPPKFKWTVEIEGDEEWAGRRPYPVNEWLAHNIEYWLKQGPWDKDEIGKVTVKIIDAPDPAEIERVRGKS